MGLAEDVELFGSFPALLVSVRRTDAHSDHRPCRNRNPFQLNLFGGESLDGGQRRLEAQSFLYRLGDQPMIFGHRGELVGMDKQQMEQVARGPVGGFQPGG